MAGSATLYTEQAVLGHTLGYAAFTMPAGIYVGLCTSTLIPGPSTPGNEVSGNAYVRRSAVFAAAGGNLASNTATLEWPAATASWGTIGYFELWDALSAGNRLYWGPLVDPIDGVTPVTRLINTGDILRLVAGSVTVQAV